LPDWGIQITLVRLYLLYRVITLHKEANVNCNEVITEWKRHTVIVTCTDCDKSQELAGWVYHKKWGYNGTENRTVADWLHGREGENVTEVFNITFYDNENSAVVGTTRLPMKAIEQLKVGDIIEFKETPIIGQFTIQSFAVNSGHPDGEIVVVPIKSRAKIRIKMDDQYMSSILPF
jgi:flagellar motor switch/type III secretory pathway protein FliN